jgi:hypothetical protein
MATPSKSASGSSLSAALYSSGSAKLYSFLIWYLVNGILTIISSYQLLKINPDFALCICLCCLIFRSLTFLEEEEEEAEGEERDFIFYFLFFLLEKMNASEV